MTARTCQLSALSRRIPVVLDTRVVTGSGGGPDKTILNSPRFFAGAGYRMLCAYMHPPEDRGFDQLRSKARAWKAPLLSVPDRGPWDWRVVSRLLDICRRERVSIWHGHDYKSNALGLLVRRFHPMRMVTTVHGWVKETPRTPLYYKVDKVCLARYESVICVSPDLHQQCIAAGVPANRCVVIENGIDTKQFARQRTTAEAKAILGIPAGRLIVGAVGRLSPEKGFDYFLRAVQTLLARGRDIALFIAGEGEEKPHLQALTAELGLIDRVHFLGYRADLRDIYEAMDVFALSSIREGLPNVLLEAMAMSVPVVATRIAGIPHLLNDRQNGLLVEPGSTEELTKALDQLLCDAPLRALLARNGRQTVETRYDFANRITRIRSIYDNLLAVKSHNNALVS